MQGGTRPEEVAVSLSSGRYVEAVPPEISDRLVYEAPGHTAGAVFDYTLSEIAASSGRSCLCSLVRGSSTRASKPPVGKFLSVTAPPWP